MIRTDVVTLSTIDGVAYRQKLTAGGSGIVILRRGAKQPGIASISKTSGEAILSANTPKKLYPQKAFREAIALTAGMPYHRLGKVELADVPAAPQEEEKAEEVVVDSREYQAVVDKFTDKSGRLSYALLNKGLIKFAHSSSIVRKMREEGRKPEEVCLYAVGTKFRKITGNDKLTDAQVLKIVELLDEVSPKGVLTEFSEELRRPLK